MATTKTVSVLDNNTTLTASAADHDSSVWDLQDGWGGDIHVKITNGATGPTVGAQVQLYSSPDNSNWYKYGGTVYQGGTANDGVYSWTIFISIGVKYLKAVSGSNTGQDVTLRIEGTEVSAVA
jgi:hypothetical protein